MDKGTTCLITGANAGIGKAAALAFAKAGCTVLMGCRNEGRGLAARDDIRSKSGNPSVQLILIDIGSQESVRNAARSILENHPRIDALIHNAADFDISRKAAVESPDGIETVWATNHLGPVLLTELLMPALRRSAQGRIVTVASQGLSLYPNLRIRHGDPEFRNARYGVQKAYYHSKLAQVMYSFRLARELAGTGITVNCIRVPAVRIDISRYPGLSPFLKWMYSVKSRMSITPEEMAETYLWLATDPGLAGASGGYYDEKRRPVQPSAYARRPDEQDRLMETTARFLRRG